MSPPAYRTRNCACQISRPILDSANSDEAGPPRIIAIDDDVDFVFIAAVAHLDLKVAIGDKSTEQDAERQAALRGSKCPISQSLQRIVLIAGYFLRDVHGLVSCHFRRDEHSSHGTFCRVKGNRMGSTIWHKSNRSI